jgi:hypothetical protein
MENMRRSPRFDAANLVSFTAFDSKGSFDCHSYSKTLNLSKEGMLLEMRQPLDLHALIHIALRVGERIIQIQGKIVRIEQQAEKRFAVGISFLYINPFDREIFHEFLKNKSEKNKEELPSSEEP